MPEKIEENVQVSKTVDKEIHRVSPVRIQSLIDSLEFETQRISETRVHTQAKLKSFVIADGFAGCVDPQAFDLAIGTKIAEDAARRIAIDKLWEFEGYALFLKLNPEFSEVPPLKNYVVKLDKYALDNIHFEGVGQIKFDDDADKILIETSADTFLTADDGDYLARLDNGDIFVLTDCGQEILETI